MFRHSSLGTSCLLMALTLLGTSFGSPINDTSGDLLSSFAQSKILLMGVLGHNLMIITNDTPPMVYQVPMAKYDNSQIDLYGVVPVELKDKWPMLYSNDNFTKRVLHDGMAQSFSIGMNKETFVFAFNSRDVNVILETVTFAIKPPSATYQEFKIENEDFNLKHAHLISSDEPNVFFNLEITDGGTTYRLYKFSFINPDGFKTEWKFAICKSSNGNDSIGEVVFNSIYSKCSSIDWKIENGGLVYQNRFHLFTKDQVYIFEYTGPGNSSEVMLKVVKLTDFFVRIIPTTTTTTVRTTTEKASNMMVFIIVAVVGVIVLALIAVAVWFFCLKKSKNKLDKNSNNKKDSAQNSQVESAVSSEMGQNPPPTPKGSSSASAGGLSNPKVSGKVSTKAMKTKVAKGNLSSKQAKQAKQPKLAKQAKIGKQSKSKSRSKASKSASKSSSH